LQLPWPEHDRAHCASTVASSDNSPTLHKAARACRLCRNRGGRAFIFVAVQLKSAACWGIATQGCRRGAQRGGWPWLWSVAAMSVLLDACPILWMIPPRAAV